MNLMFWKKKTPGDTQQGEADDDRTVAIARDGETAEENNVEDAVRPGLLTRLRNALSLRKPRDSSTETGETQKNDPDNDRTVAIKREVEATEDKEEDSVRPSLLARLRNAMSALRKPRDSAAEDETPGRDKAADRRDDETPAVVPARNMKKRLIIGGAIGLLVILLAGIGFAITKILLPHPEQKPATAEASHATHPAPHAETPQTEIEALKKKNAELQTQLEAIKKEQPQAQSPTMRSQETGEYAASGSLPSGGEMTVSNKDPKAAAQALKAAIEAMNAGSDEQKPHKPAP